jgi:hypothetical protein
MNSRENVKRTEFVFFIMKKKKKGLTTWQQP